MIRVHAFTNQVGCGLGPNGNPEVMALDDSGVAVSIEFTPEAWKQFLSAAGRLRGAGIIPAEFRDIADAAEQARAEHALESELRTAAGNGS